MKTIDIPCMGYAVKTDVYEGSAGGPVLLSLIGRTSYRKKQHYIDQFTELANDLGITTVIFDYSGHGDSPFDIEDISPAQHFLEVIEVFDWMKQQYPNREVIVIGSSYGGFQATQLTKYRQFDKLLLRAPAIYKPNAFYTKKKDEDSESTEEFRRNPEALAAHPLLARASKFAGKTLLIVHGSDEQIPKETTDAYANAFKAEVVTVEGLPHSLDDASLEQISAYNSLMKSWIEQ